jgi:HAD superfamily hydrolase (TIGR01509 family)
MQLLENYTLFLFDLDGLLVNTEEVHFRAYGEMARKHGLHLDLTFPEYFRMAQASADAPKNYFYSHFPKLLAEEPNWDVLYREKKQAVLELLKKEGAKLLPGAEEFLRMLEKAGKRRVIVTHSGDELTEIIRAKNPVLNTVSGWITRHDYSRPKPFSDSYLKAIEKFGSGGPIIGFEDSERGMEALLGTSATPVLVNSFDAELASRYKARGVMTFRSLEELLRDTSPVQEKAPSPVRS